MLPGFENIKPKKSNNPHKETFDLVNYKLCNKHEPTLPEVRTWFIYDSEEIYNCKMLGTNTIYCYKTLNAVKSKFNIKTNYELCNKLKQWRTAYIALYGKDKMFDFSKLNTNWLMEELNSTPSYNVDNDYKPNSKNRRI